MIYNLTHPHPEQSRTSRRWMERMASAVRADDKPRIDRLLDEHKKRRSAKNALHKPETNN